MQLYLLTKYVYTELTYKVLASTLNNIAIVFQKTLSFPHK